MTQIPWSKIKINPFHQYFINRICCYCKCSNAIFPWTETRKCARKMLYLYRHVRQFPLPFGRLFIAVRTTSVPANSIGRRILHAIRRSNKMNVNKNWSASKPAASWGVSNKCLPFAILAKTFRPMFCQEIYSSWFDNY